MGDESWVQMDRHEKPTRHYLLMLERVECRFLFICHISGNNYFRKGAADN